MGLVKLLRRCGGRAIHPFTFASWTGLGGGGLRHSVAAVLPFHLLALEQLPQPALYVGALHALIRLGQRRGDLRRDEPLAFVGR